MAICFPRETARLGAGDPFAFFAESPWHCVHTAMPKVRVQIKCGEGVCHHLLHL